MLLLNIYVFYQAVVRKPDSLGIIISKLTILPSKQIKSLRIFLDCIFCIEEIVQYQIRNSHV